jgi:uncharacterized surface protein with fasciclin (FAS1) repeats
MPLHIYLIGNYVARIKYFELLNPDFLFLRNYTCYLFIITYIRNHNKMKKISTAVVLFIAIMTTQNTMAQGNKTMKEMTVEVGGSPMYPSKNIIENAVNSKDHTTLVAAVKAAGLVETLQGKGPFTVFAPTNAAFDKLPPGTVDALVQPENKAQLSSILTYHVVPGKLSSQDLMNWVKKGGGMTTLKTVQGGKIWIIQNTDGLWVKDEKGNKARISIADVNQSNGVIHVIDTVLLPQ